MPPLGARAGLWSFVTYPDGEKGKWKCNFCGKRLAGSAGRLAAHLAKDGSDPGVAACAATVSDEAVSAAEAFISDASKKRMFSKESKARKKGKLSSKMSINMQMSQCLDPIFRDDTDTALINFICANMLPLSILEDFHFKRFISFVSQSGNSYSLPSRHMASSILLDSTLARTTKESVGRVTEDQDNFGSTVFSDVLSLSHPHSLANYMLSTPNQEKVLKIFDCGDALRDGRLVIDQLESFITPKIDMVVLSNSERSILHSIEAKWPWISALPCAASILSNFFSDLSLNGNSWWGNIARRSCLVCSMFRSHQLLLSLLRANDGNVPLLPQDSRLAGDLVMMWRLSLLQQNMVASITSQEFMIIYEQLPLEARMRIVDPVREEILSTEFWDDVHFYLDLSSVLGTLLIQLDANQPVMGEVIPSLIEAKSRALSAADCKTDSNRREALLTLSESIDLAWDRIKHPAYSAAYLLHPKYAGEELGQIGLNPEFEKDLLHVIARQIGNDSVELQRAMTEYISFRAGQGVLQEPVFRSLARGSLQEPHMPGHLWWQAVGTNWRFLRPFAMKLLSKIPSASHSGKSWNKADPYLANRNCKLGSGAMGKMLQINQNLTCMTSRISISQGSSFADLVQVSDAPNYTQFLKKEPNFDDEDLILATPEGKLMGELEQLPSHAPKPVDP